MKIQFVKKLNLSKGNVQRLLEINEVLEDYAAQGYSLTLRQLYYQLVTKNIIANKPEEYDKLGNLLTKGRLNGVIDWDAIEDRIRIPRHTYEVDNIEDAISDTEKLYRLDRQRDQNCYIELWVEKDAISNILIPKTQYYHIRLMVNRGYSSTTAMFDAYNRFLVQLGKGKTVDVLYLGDHDSSGLDIALRDLFERIFLMLSNQPTHEIYKVVNELSEEEVDKLMDKYEEDPLSRDDEGYIDSVRCYILEKFHIQHIGLTTEQVKLYNPPPNPVKIKDPRAKWYIKNFGDTSWEVDALTPQVFHQIIDTAILKLIDESKFNAILNQEKVDKEELRELPAVRIDYPVLKEKFEEVEENCYQLGLENADRGEKIDRLLEEFSEMGTQIVKQSTKIRNAKTFIETLKIDKKIQKELLSMLS